MAQRGKNITIEDLVLNALTKHGYTGSDDKCLLQCFELSTMTKFHSRSEVKLVFHLETLDQTNLENLQKIKNEGVYAIGLDKKLIVPKDDKGNCGAPNLDSKKDDGWILSLFWALLAFFGLYLALKDFEYFFGK